MKDKIKLNVFIITMSLILFAALNTSEFIGKAQAAIIGDASVQIGQAAACTYEKAIDEKAINELSNEKSNYIAVPTTMDELVELNWTPEEADVEVAGGSFYQMAFHKGEDVIYAVVQNWNDEPEMFSQLLIYTLSTYDENALTVNMIHVGSDEENVASCFDNTRTVSISEDKAVYECISDDERYSVVFNCENHKVSYLEINACE